MKSIPDAMWESIKDIIPERKSKRGRPEICKKKAMNAIFFILRTGIQWNMLPREYGASSTVYGKFKKWLHEGVFAKLHSFMIYYYKEKIECLEDWAAIDTTFSKAPLAKKWSGPNPTDRRKRGIKKSIIVDTHGAPLAVTVAAANRHDSKTALETLFELKKNFKSKKILTVEADSAYDAKHLKNEFLQKNCILDVVKNPRKSKIVVEKKPSNRWIVERTHSWMNNFRSLKICWTKLPESFLALCQFACCCTIFQRILFFE